MPERLNSPPIKISPCAKDPLNHPGDHYLVNNLLIQSLV